MFCYQSRTSTDVTGSAACGCVYKNMRSVVQLASMRQFLVFIVKSPTLHAPLSANLCVSKCVTALLAVRLGLQQLHLTQSIALAQTPRLHDEIQAQRENSRVLEGKKLRPCFPFGHWRCVSSWLLFTAASDETRLCALHPASPRSVSDIALAASVCQRQPFAAQ
eukprot:1299-Heterococcus_DN1.PRE.1